MRITAGLIIGNLFLALFSINAFSQGRHGHGSELDFYDGGIYDNHCRADLVNIRGGVIDSFVGHGYDQRAACQEARFICGEELHYRQRQGANLRASCITQNNFNLFGRTHLFVSAIVNGRVISIQGNNQFQIQNRCNLKLQNLGIDDESLQDMILSFSLPTKDRP